MDNVTVKSGTLLEDSILSDEVTVGEKCGVKMSIIGKGQNVDNGAHQAEHDAALHSNTPNSLDYLLTLGNPLLSVRGGLVDVCMGRLSHT